MKRRHALTAALLAVIAIGGCAAGRPAEAMRDEGDRLFKLGEYEAAAAEYRQIVERFPGDWQAQYKLGLSLLELDRPTAARSALEVAHTRRPSVVAVADALAEALYRDGEATLLFKFLRERVDATQSTHAYLRLAKYSLRLDDPDSAAWAVDRAIERAAGRDVDPYLAAASLAQRVGNREDAVRRLRQAYGIAPDDERVASRLRALGEVPGPTIALPPGLQRVGMADLPKLLAHLSALGDVARLRIMRLLAAHELSVGELARALQLPQSTVSRHLKLLHEGGWTVKRTEGTASLYAVVAERLDEDARALWEVARDRLGRGPTLREDDSRLREVLLERRRDSRTFFGDLGGAWDELRHDLFGTGFTAEALLALVPETSVVADLGCGTGNAAELLAPFVRRIIAVDREPAMIEAARKRLRGIENVEFRQGDIDDLPIDEATIDAAMFLLVLQHAPKPQRAIAGAARALRPGGRVLVVDMVAHDRESYRHTMGHRHLGFDERAVGAWAEAAGLEQVRYGRLRPDTTAKGPGLFVATMRKKG